MRTTRAGEVALEPGDGPLQLNDALPGIAELLTEPGRVSEVDSEAGPVGALAFRLGCPDTGPARSPPGRIVLGFHGPDDMRTRRNQVVHTTVTVCEEPSEP